ncbi:MAG TPA: hypothetical protein VKR06_42235 [Ktedonosporobacter sp.]|nr:hypothetical protein [Ktedonosporobacter sp.]
MLTELQAHLRLVYTPAYDPDANRIEWLWRVSRRVLTHNHHRRTFDLLLADLETHFQTLARTPAEVLRHIGSPFAPDKEAPLPFTYAARLIWKHIARSVAFGCCDNRRIGSRSPDWNAHSSDNGRGDQYFDHLVYKSTNKL